MKGIVFILILTLLFGAGSFVFTKYFVSPTYTTSIKFYASGTENKTQLLNYYQSAAPQYVEFLNGAAFSEMVAQDLQTETGLVVTSAQVQKSVAVSDIIEDTSSFYVVVTTESAEMTYYIASSFARKAPERVASIEGADALQILEAPKMPTVASGPNLTKNLLIGFFLGFLVAVSIVILKELLDTRIKTADEITATFGLPVFGVVPDFSVSDKKGVQR
jgi:capsular polysaccharide biosynthesis protein